jgi:hypothetical protein
MSVQIIVYISKFSQDWSTPLDVNPVDPTQFQSTYTLSISMVSTTEDLEALLVTPRLAKVPVICG